MKLVTSVSLVSVAGILTLLFLGAPIVQAQASWNWVACSLGQSRPANALFVGRDGGDTGNADKNLYVCRSNYAGGVHPGKLVGGRCNIGFGGREYETNDYEVLVVTGSGYSWGHGSIDGALIGGHEANGDPLYVCRARYMDPSGCAWPNCSSDRGVHSGKLVSGKCNIGFGGAEKEIESYELFYPNGQK